MPELVRAARAATMQPGRALLEDAAIIHERGVIHEVGPYSLVSRTFSGPTLDLGDVTLAPGPINAHTHLELCHLHGKTLSGQGFVPWLEHMLAQPFDQPDPGTVAGALAKIKHAGTACVADTSTRNVEQMAGILDESGLSFVAFKEIIGQDAPEGPLRPAKRFRRGHIAPAGHALYSTSPEALRAAKAISTTLWLPFSLHLAEHDAEVEYLTTGQGPMREFLENIGKPPKEPAPGVSPVARARDLGLLDKHTLAVHCVKVDETDIHTLAGAGASICLCPRSNRFIGGDRGPWEAIIGSRANVCLGTDSLASNHDLDPVAELLYLLEHLDMTLTLREALSLITMNAAKALGLDGVLGSLEPGKLARWWVVDKKLEAALR